MVNLFGSGTGGNTVVNLSLNGVGLGFSGGFNNLRIDFERFDVSEHK
ncbi:hypothetical protein AGMMS49975_17240 [Clostridia bacterium]|nr:hypothetical protein AGMMS49975_17240 [Clostridia bacterium]